MALSLEEIQNLNYKETIKLANKHKLGHITYPDVCNGGVVVTGDYSPLDRVLAYYEKWKKKNPNTYEDSIKQRSGSENLRI